MLLRSPHSSGWHTSVAWSEDNSDDGDDELLLELLLLLLLEPPPLREKGQDTPQAGAQVTCMYPCFFLRKTKKIQKVNTRSGTIRGNKNQQLPYFWCIYTHKWMSHKKSRNYKPFWEIMYVIVNGRSTAILRKSFFHRIVIAFASSSPRTALRAQIDAIIGAVVALQTFSSSDRLKMDHCSVAHMR